MTPKWLAYVGLAGLLFGLWQYAARELESRGESKAVLAELRESVKEQRQALHEHLLLINDLRVQVADLGRVSRFIHGELKP